MSACTKFCLKKDANQCLDPIMKDVVKKEILKWIDAGIIYPLFVSSWVSPFQCVLKKEGIIVVPNQNNKLIPSKTVTG